MLKYQQVEVENLWKTTRAWLNPNSTYKEFKDEIVKLYPGASGNSTYLLQDLDATIGRFTRIGIWGATDLGDYHRWFITITRYLISMNCLSTHDEAWHFFRGLPPNLEDKVRGRLQLKLVDHLPDDPYELDDIYEAATYVLRDASFLAGSSQQHHGALAAKTTITAIPDPVSVKIEALTTVVATLTETIKTAIQGPRVPAGQSSGPSMASATGMSAPTNSACNFCGVPGHFICECEIVAEYMHFGKCKRSHDGKVVLPLGAMVPKSIRGTWLRERIDEYHRQNPGQTASQMLLEVSSIEAAIRSFQYPAKPANQFYTEEMAQAYAFNWPSCPPPPPPEVVITTLPPHRRGHPGPNKRTEGITSNVAPTRATIEEILDESEEAPGSQQGKTSDLHPRTSPPVRRRSQGYPSSGSRNSQN